MARLDRNYAASDFGFQPAARRAAAETCGSRLAAPATQLLRKVVSHARAEGLARRAPYRSVSVSPAGVRVYRGPSRTTMIGTFDAVCKMLDRFVAEDEALRSAPVMVK